jgi:hypothetical protein
VKDIAELDLNVADVRSAVNLADTLKARYQSTPLDFFEILSVTLSKHPDIELRKMEWMQTHNRNHSFGESKKQLNPALARVMQSGMVGFLYQKSLFDAVVSDYDENPRIALEKMDSFIRDLIQQQNEYAVEIVKMPFDIDPASRFVGQAGSGGADQEAKFSFVMSKEVQL